MNDRIEPSHAARALSEVDRRREQAIRREVIPGWWWWATALLIVELAASLESGRALVAWIGIALFVAGSLVINVPVLRADRAAPLRRGLVSGSTRIALIGVAAFVAVQFGVAAAATLSLHAAGVAHPVTIGAAITAVVFALSGQMLVRVQMDILVRRSRSRE
jgi:hypothetical protein